MGKDGEREKRKSREKKRTKKWERKECMIEARRRIKKALRHGRQRMSSTYRAAHTAR